MASKDTKSNPSPSRPSILTLRLDVIAKAQAARKAAVKGTAKVVRKVRTTASFRLPKTLALSRTPKYERKALPKRADKMDQFAIIKFPLNTESAMRQIEEHNTLVFVCDVRANKAQIKAAVKGLYGVEVASVNTLVRPDNQKKAYVRLAPECDALETAGKIGFI
jgi:large subunit ribosomal protein L23Ae